MNSNGGGKDSKQAETAIKRNQWLSMILGQEEVTAIKYLLDVPRNGDINRDRTPECANVKARAVPSGPYGLGLIGSVLTGGANVGVRL